MIDLLKTHLLDLSYSQWTCSILGVNEIHLDDDNLTRSDLIASMLTRRSEPVRLPSSGWISLTPKMGQVHWL